MAVIEEPQAVVRQAPARMPEGLREPLVLFYREGRSTREAAEIRLEGPLGPAGPLHSEDTGQGPGFLTVPGEHTLYVNASGYRDAVEKLRVKPFDPQLARPQDVVVCLDRRQNRAVRAVCTWSEAYNTAQPLSLAIRPGAGVRTGRPAYHDNGTDRKMGCRAGMPQIHLCKGVTEGAGPAGRGSVLVPVDRAVSRRDAETGESAGGSRRVASRVGQPPRTGNSCIRTRKTLDLRHPGCLKWAFG